MRREMNTDSVYPSGTEPSSPVWQSVEINNPAVVNRSERGKKLGERSSSRDLLQSSTTASEITPSHLPAEIRGSIRFHPGQY